MSSRETLRSRLNWFNRGSVSTRFVNVRVHRTQCSSQNDIVTKNKKDKDQIRGRREPHWTINCSQQWCKCLSNACSTPDRWTISLSARTVNLMWLPILVWTRAWLFHMCSQIHHRWALFFFNFQTHLFVEPASHHHWDVEVSFNSMIPLAKTVYFPCTSGALQKAKENRTSSLRGSFAEESCEPIYCAYLR